MAEGLRVRVLEIKGHKFEIRAVAEGNRVVVRAYSGGKPATPFSYSIESDTQHDLARLRGLDVIETLMEIAQKDVQESVHGLGHAGANGG